MERTSKRSTAERFCEAARLLKALAHPLRLEILCGLRRQPATQTTIARALGVPQPTVAQHLRVLRSMGIVRCERRGVEVLIRIDDNRVPRIVESLCALKEHEREWSWSELGAIERARRALGLG
jgi:ArsR family transcriptional regulator